VRLTNAGTAPLTVESVTSLLCAGLSDDDPGADLGDLDILWCENDWLAEGRWQRCGLRAALPDLNRRLGVVFNDYMNTLMGEPTTERLLPLIEAAAAVGAEYFVIDAGWYAEPGEGWWDTVGAWRPAAAGFPGGGLSGVFDRIRTAGMVPGLWANWGPAT
jgi:Melibiase